MRETQSISMKKIRTKPWPRWPIFTEEDKKAVARVINSNQLFAASEVKAFEEAFSKYIGSKYALGVGNGTEGLHLALAALNIGINDEVIVTPYTWISSASCALMQNAVPIFADIELETLGLSAEAVKENITERTKAIVLVHMFGYPANVESIRKVANEYDIALIEDASHATGAEYKDRKIGSFGDISVFSLHQRKNLCVGDGGMVVTDKEKFASKIYRLRSFGHDELSYNYRMTEFAAAIGRTRLKRLDDENKIRKQNADYMIRLLKDLPGIKVRKPIQKAIGVYYRLLFDYDPSQFNVSLDAFIKSVNKEGIPFDKTFPPLHRHPHFNPDSIPARGCPWKWPLYTNSQLRPLNYKNLKFQIAEEYCDNRLFELSIHPPVGKNDIQQAAEAIKKVIKKVKKE